MMKPLIILFIFIDFTFGLSQEATLYATLVRTKGYVAGSELTASGLYQFRSDTTWTHTGWNNPRVYGMALDPTDAHIIYLACGNGVLRTRDGGQNWKLTTDWRITEALDIAVDPFDPDKIYVATSFGIWRAENGGDTWIEANNGLNRTFTQTIRTDTKMPNRAIAGTESGIYQSSDSGKNWRLVGGEDLLILDIEQSLSSPARWIAGAQDHGALISKNNGFSWNPAVGEIARYTIYDVAIDPFNADLLAAAGWNTGVFLSRNGGETWTQHDEGLPSRNIYALTFDVNRSGNLWVAPVEKGIFLSDDFGRTYDYKGMNGTLVFALTMAFQREH